MLFPDLDLFWCKSGKNKTFEIVKKLESFDGFKPDVIYASCLPVSSGSLGAHFSDYYKVPLVIEFRDKWVDSPYRNVNFIRRIFEKRYERELFRKASAVVGASEWLASLGMKYSLMSNVVYTGLDDINTSNTLVNNYKFDFIDETKKLILYTGMVYPGKRDPLKLIEIFNKNIDSISDDYQLIFAGKNFDYIESQSTSGSVVFLGQIDRAMVLELQKRSDILLLLTWDNIQEKGVISGKVFEYLAAQKPILHIGYAEGEVAKLVNSSGLSFSQDSKYIDIINGIKSLNELVICKQGFKNLETGKQVDKLISLLESVVDGY